MINDGWEFGRLPTDKCGYKAGKYIRITNDILDKYILKDDPIPDGYHRGMSKIGKQNQSNACMGRPGTTTGKKMIINKTTNETRYINSNDIVPIGWQYGNKQKGIKRSENVK